jgi:hypothetical protein
MSEWSLDDGIDSLASEPSAVALADTTEEMTEGVDCSFGNHDFGYPRTLDELNGALDEADRLRNDSSQWISNIAFHTHLESKYSWLR